MKNRIAIIACLLAATMYASAQKVLYTLKPGERIVMESENRLLSINRAFFHLLFTERGTDKYVIYNGKEHGPFISIGESESAPSLLDWAVMKKDSMWYQLILDKDQLIGPYEYVIDVFRNDNPADPANDQSHYGFRARKNGQWYIIVDGKEWGPYPEPDGWTPQFSTDGTNWAAPCYDEEKQNYLIVSPKGSFSVKGRQNGMTFRGNELLTEMQVDKGSFVFEGDSISFRNMSGSAFSVQCGNRKLTSESYSLTELFDAQGKVLESANEMNAWARGPNLIITYVKYTPYDNNGQPVEVIANGDKYQHLYPDGCTYTGIPVIKKLVKEYFVKVNDQVLGPYGPMSLYGAYPGFAKGKSAFVAEPGGVLVVDGKPTATKGVQALNYNPITGSTVCIMQSGDMLYNGKNVGKFGEDAYVNLDLPSDQFSVNYTKEDKVFVYVSAAKKSIGPFEEAPLIVFSTDKLHWGYVHQRKVYVDGVVKAQQAFDLVYDPTLKAFKWITLNGKQILLNEFKTL